MEHDGHRKRMRERFRQSGLEGFAPHEVLELLLFYGRARGDVNPLAHRLLDAFGSLKGVLEARPEQLMSVEGIGEETATLISMMLPVFRRYSACVCEERKTIRNRSEALDYCKALLGGWRTEHFYVLCFSTDHHLLGQRLIAEGSLTEVSAYPRLVAETALNYNAYSVLLCHNHPSGLCLPSPEDIRTTHRMQAMLNHLDIVLLDHIIVAGDNAYSLAQNHELADLPPSPASLIPPGGKSTLLPGSRRNKAASAKTPAEGKENK